MVEYRNGLTAFILTLVSLIHGLFTSFTSLIVVIILIHHLCRTRLKKEEKITLILSTNIYVLLLIYSMTLISVNILTLLGDIHGIIFNLSWCIFRGYFICVMCCGMYQSFVIQALYRFCRIVYPQYRFVKRLSLYVISIPMQLILACILVCPNLIMQDVVYIPNDHDCFISFINVRGMLYVICVAYGLPLLELFIIYIRITLFLRRQANNNIAIAIQRRQKRDLVAIQRIFINVGLLVIIGVPAIVVLLMDLITGVEYSLTYRIMWLGAEISTALLSIEMVIMTPQLRNIVFKRRHRRNRVTSVNGSLNMGAVSTIH